MFKTIEHYEGYPDAIYTWASDLEAKRYYEDARTRRYLSPYQLGCEVSPLSYENRMELKSKLWTMVENTLDYSEVWYEECGMKNV